MSYLANAAALLITLASDAVALLFVLRLLAEACRADFTNPLSHAIYRGTNPVLAPLRRVLPNWRRINLVAILILWLTMLLKNMLLLALTGVSPTPLALLLVSIADAIDFVLLTYTVLIIGWSLLSMLAPDPRQPVLRLAAVIVEPLLRPWRRRLVMGALDFSPLVVLLLLSLARLLLIAPLYDLAARLHG